MRKYYQGSPGPQQAASATGGSSSAAPCTVASSTGDGDNALDPWIAEASSESDSAEGKDKDEEEPIVSKKPAGRRRKKKPESEVDGADVQEDPGDEDLSRIPISRCRRTYASFILLSHHRDNHKN